MLQLHLVLQFNYEFMVSSLSSSYHFLPKVLCLLSLATKIYQKERYILCTLEQFRSCGLLGLVAFWVPALQQGTEILVTTSISTTFQSEQEMKLETCNRRNSLVSASKLATDATEDLLFSSL